MAQHLDKRFSNVDERFNAVDATMADLGPKLDRILGLLDRSK